MTIEKLTTALTQAAEAHHAFEQANFPAGKTDPNWQHWYASWIINTYGPLVSPSASED